MEHDDLLCPTDRGLSRRSLLHGASVGIGASMLGGLFNARSRAEQGPQHYPTLGITKPSLDSMPQAWSNSEFHRRWDALRKLMKEAKLDCLIVPQHPHGGIVLDEYPTTDADVSWLAGIPAGWVVFPIEGKITVIGGMGPDNVSAQLRPLPGIIMTTLFADNSPDIENWSPGGTERGLWSAPLIDGAPSANQAHGSHPERGFWSATLINVLREKKMEQARIGVGSLDHVFRNFDGSVSFSAYDRVRKAFPQAQFENAADMLWQVKWVHSAEEIAAFEKVTAVSEAGLLAMLGKARPGVTNRDVWLSMYGAMLECSGSRPQHLILTTHGATGLFGCPLPDTIDSGQILCQECSGSLLGYGAQVNHAVLIGSEGPADWPAAAQYSIDLFHTLLDRVAPGKNIKEVLDFYVQRLRERGETSKRLASGVIIHFDGCGDLPRIGPGQWEGPEDAVWQPGMVFDLKLDIVVKGTPFRASFGDPVLVTEKGARRLGKRKLEIINLA